ncbi:aminoglycoside phosphotransferase family protein [Agromyces mangrovi Wang et al. 2018]|uniref:aminoglycoside phosphotransferase family protein n=1 Tax=Agromyces mangrovi TaxID=1858653 RepID=UPI0025735550|nr:aminoglycoside phosphotransferase family protein [Agromyces mangrovi]
MAVSASPERPAVVGATTLRGRVGPPMRAADVVLESWLDRWRLAADGLPFETRTSRLLPVRTEEGVVAMLKVSRSDEERRGGTVLAAWGGAGAAPVLRVEDDALLVVRATGGRNLVTMVEAGRDEAATRVLCETAARLHAASDAVRPVAGEHLVPLAKWFRDLSPQSDVLGAFHRRGADIAAELLDEQVEVVALHGDLHHGNVLDFGASGWLAIDPKGLLGDRAFDYCNLFCNPGHLIPLARGRLEATLKVVTDASGLAPRRMLRWLVAWCALSSTWYAIDDDLVHSRSVAAIGELAAGVLDRELFA